MNKDNQQPEDFKEDDTQALTLQNMMFDQMKRLSNPDNDLEQEIKRSQALSAAGTVIINAAKVRIDAVRVGHQTKKEPNRKLLGNGK